MNIDAVARRAGVSPATVSRTINGTARVSDSTAARVQEAIETLRFVPNSNAQSLGSGRSGLYGLIISDITNPYFPELVKAFENVALENKREVLIGDTDYDTARMKACVVRMIQRRVDAIAIMTSELHEDALSLLAERRMPTVFMDTGKLPEQVNVVRVDYAAGIRIAVRHLAELGHRDIAFIAGPPPLHSAKVRLRSFRSAVKKSGIRLRPEWILEGNHQVSGGHAAVSQLMRLHPLPTAIVCSNDLTAIGAVGALIEAGIRVPEHVSVVGFDDIVVSGYTQPPLTTLRVAREALASAAFRMLLQAEGNRARTMRFEDETFTPELVVRRTTAPPRRGLPKRHS